MNTPIKVYQSKPRDFAPQVEVASCYFEVGDELLLLQRAIGQSEEGLWGIPAGRIELSESPQDGMIRELYEETGIGLTEDHTIESLGELYICKPSIAYVFHMFRVDHHDKPEVCLSGEHQNYSWVSRGEILNMDLMAGAVQALQIYFQ